MSSYRYIDDIVLIKLLQAKREKPFYWQTAYTSYRLPFVRFFNEYGIPSDQGLQAYKTAFAKLLFEIRHDSMAPPLRCSLFQYLVVLGYQTLTAEGIVEVDRPEGTDAEQAGRFLSGNAVLSSLRAEEERRAFNTVHTVYRVPANRLMNERANFKNEEAEEQYSAAMLKFHKDILNGKPPLPLFGKLFNYFLKIFWGKIRDAHRSVWEQQKNEGKKIVQTIDEQAWKDLSENHKPTEEEKTFYHYLLDRWPILDQYGADTPYDLILQLAAEKDEISRKVVKLRVEGYAYKEIAEMLKLSESNAKRIQHNCIVWIRNRLNILKTR